MPRRTNSRAVLAAAAGILALGAALAACSAQPIDSVTNNAITPGPPLPDDMTWPSHAANYRPGQLPLTPSVTGTPSLIVVQPSNSPTETSPAISPLPGPSSYANQQQTPGPAGGNSSVPAQNPPAATPGPSFLSNS